MNPVTFNDGFERMLLTYPFPDFIARFRTGWQHAPLFDYVTSYEREKFLLKDGDVPPLEEVHMPFDTLRLAITETAVPWIEGQYEIGHGTYRTNFVVIKEPDQSEDGVAPIETRRICSDNDVFSEAFVSMMDKRFRSPSCSLLLNIPSMEVEIDCEMQSNSR